MFSSSKRLERGWRGLVWEKVRALSNHWLLNEEKSDNETYQNTQICYEGWEMGQDSVRSSSALYVRRLWESLLRSLPNSDSDRKTCKSKNVQMASKRKNELKMR